MKKGISAALADELVNTVIHRFQLPGSGAQLNAQAGAIREIAATLEKHAGVSFPGLADLVAEVKLQMPSIYGMVPHIFYELRRLVENNLSKDDFLRHIVNVHTLRGNKQDLYYLVPILKNPDIPQSFKDEQMEHGMFFIADTETLESVRTIIIEIGGDKAQEMLASIARHISGAVDGDKLREATAAIIDKGDFNPINELPLDFIAMLSITGQADAVLDHLFKHYLTEYYDKGIID